MTKILLVEDHEELWDFLTGVLLSDAHLSPLSPVARGGHVLPDRRVTERLHCGGARQHWVRVLSSFVLGNPEYCFAVQLQYLMSL